MVNYTNGKIYKILDLTNDNFYIGSTTKEYLSQRLEKHRTHYKDYLQGKHHYMSSFEILTNENYKILLLEHCSCVSKDDLRTREQYYMDKLKCDKMVNKQRAFSTEEDKKQNRKEYYENNKEQVLEKQKIYYENNKDRKAESKKEYREANKERIAEKAKEKVQCDRCNSIISKKYFKKHQKTNSCLNALPHGLICELAE
jgi:hypothetical protein